VYLPIEFAIGLGLEAAIVVNASNSRYSEEVSYDGQLLNIAITRVLH
jgi:DNA helicase IV